MNTFIRETLETNKKLKLSPITLNLLHQAQKLEKIDKEELIKLLVNLASIKTEQANLSHEKFKGIMNELKSDSINLLKRVSI